MDKGQILVAIHNMRGEYAHKMGEDLKRIGRIALEEGDFSAHALDYYEAKAKVVVLDELLEKIANTPDDTGEVKHNPFCNEIIRDSQGNEIARAKGV